MSNTDVQERLDLLAAIHAIDEGVPALSAFHRIATGGELQTISSASRVYGHKAASWQLHGPMKGSDVTERRVSENGWVAITQTQGESFRVRLFDEKDELRCVVRIVPECEITHSVRSILAVEDLKRQWERSPSWDLTHTDGFGAHTVELGMHSSEMGDRWEAERISAREARIDAIVEEMERIGPRAVAERLLCLDERFDRLEKRLRDVEEE